MRRILAAALVLLVVGSADARDRRLFGRKHPQTATVATSPAPQAPQSPQWPAGVPQPMPGSVVPAAPKAPQTASTEPGDALDEVNAKRAARGLRPFLRDDNLTLGARACAAFRALNRIAGHTANDFAFGGGARATGCAAWPSWMGWGSCCTYENWTYAGAAWAIGADGKRYMQLFVR